MDAVTECNPYAVLKSTLENPSFSAHEKVLRMIRLRGETMGGLAKAAGCSRMTLYRAISGKPAEIGGNRPRRWNPEPVRRRIAAHLGVDPGVLWPEMKDPEAAGETEFIEGQDGPAAAA